MSRLIHLVADYGPGDLTYSELVQKLALAVPDALVLPTQVAAGDTMAAGFCVAELALTEGPEDRIVLHDVGSDAAQDDQLCGGHTRGGVAIIGPHVGWSWSFVVDELCSLCHLDVRVDSPRSRARGRLPFAVSHVAKRHPHAICDNMPRSSVPPVPERAVAYVDGYGNVETTMAEPPAAVGTALFVRIGRVSARAIVADRGSVVAAGELAMATGSAGWQTRAGGRRNFVELSVGGGSAAERFALPLSGAEICLQPADDPAGAT
jgi:hypothetical protein